MVWTVPWVSLFAVFNVISNLTVEKQREMGSRVLCCGEPQSWHALLVLRGQAASLVEPGRRVRVLSRAGPAPSASPRRAGLAARWASSR